jgi:ppGpp synthetase/RelA/SpoT-type nucleotidyltranferase
MLNQAIRQENLSPEAINYIKELETNYTQQIKELETNLQEYQYKYLEIKEKYDLLVYKRFVRSAEQLLADEKQPLLFIEETEQSAAK